MAVITAAQVVPDQGDVARLPWPRRCRVPMAMPDVGLGQGRSVVDAVADHGHLSPEPGGCLDLTRPCPAGQDLGDDLVDPGERGRWPRPSCRLSPVSMITSRPIPQRKLLDRRAGARFERVGQGEDAQARPAPSHEHEGLALPGQAGFGVRVEFRQSRSRLDEHEASVAQQ